jgi:uncharacterized repeat protein (TIGR03803 family)
LLRDSAGNLYGTTAAGGGACSCGVVFRLDLSGSEKVIYTFTGGADGGAPYGGVISDSAGNLYGTTAAGGTYGNGTVFMVDTTGKETALYSFTGGADGGGPEAGLVRDSAGNLYGTTGNGGAFGPGTVFVVGQTDKETVLYSFSGAADGGYPFSTLVRDLAGNLYGTTAAGGGFGNGTVFTVDTTGKETVLYSFAGGTDGADPASGLVRDLAVDAGLPSGGQAADLPYNCAYEGYTDEHLTIQNDRMSDADYEQFLADAFQSYRSIVKPVASLYICHPSSWQREFQNALEHAGFEVRCQIIWSKNTFAWGFGRYKFQHEPLFFSHVAGQTDAWYGDKSQSTLWQENKPAANRLHPTMKPVALVERALVNSSKAGNICADFFGGAGSTLIACERRGRKARLMEIDCRYAQVIIVRWQEHSGKTATLDEDGRSFAEIARERRNAAA